MKGKRKQRGFTLIDMVVVATIVSVMAATAVPKYIGLTQDVKHAAAQGIAGQLTSASASNILLRNAGSTLGQPISDCAQVANLMLPGQMAGFAIAPQPIAPGATAACTVDHSTGGSGTAATFTAYGAA
jgi:MSHA pilin protein MshA